MKRLCTLALIVMTVLSVQPFTGEAQVYDDNFDAGHVFVVTDAPSFVRFNGQSAYAETAYTVGGVYQALFDAQGNLFGSSSGGVSCLAAPSYATACDGYPVAFPSSGTVIDPTIGNIQGSPATANVSTGHDPIAAAIDTQGNVWTILRSGSTGRYLSRTYNNAGTITTVLYDVAYGDGTANPPLSIAIDMTGDVWFVKQSDSLTTDTKVFCLDASNNYEVCTGGDFGTYGDIDLTYTDTREVAVTSGNDIIVAHGAGQRLSKLDRPYFGSSFTISTTDVLNTMSSPLNQPQTLGIDASNRIWALGYTAGFDDYVLKCIDSVTMADCAIATPTQTITTTASTLAPGRPMIDGNGNVWIPNNSDNQLHCFATATGAACATATLSPSVGTFSYHATLRGDGTGQLITRLMDAMAGQQQATVSAAVDPTISLVLERTDCPLGVLSSGALSTCELGATLTTNAAYGYNFFVKNLTNNGFALAREGASDGIENVSGSCSNDAYTTEATCTGNGGTWTDYMTAGVKGAGWAADLSQDTPPSGFQSVSCSNPAYGTQATCEANSGTWQQSYCSGLTAPQCNAIDGMDQGGNCMFTDKTACENAGGTWNSACLGGNTNGNTTVIGTDAFDVVGSAIGANIFQLLDSAGATVTANLCFTAGIDDTTPAGAYSGTYQFTAVGNF